MVGNLMHCVDGLRRETVYEFTLHDWEVLDGYCQIQLYSRRRADLSSFRVDWGDGTVDTVTALSQRPLWHNYTRTGTFRVVFDEGLAWFRLVDCFAVDSRRRVYVVRPDVHPVQWGDFVESAEGSYCGWNGDLHGNTGAWGVPPPWGRSITDVTGCYSYSRHIAGRIPPWTNRIAKAMNCYQQTGVSGVVPRWPRSMVEPGGCYDGATGMHGRIPPWPEGATVCDACYRGNPNVFGPVPPWPETVTSTQRCYQDCPNVTGAIPPWPPGLVWASETYRGCTGLAGAWTDDAAELMPPCWPDGEVRQFDCVAGASEELRALFTPDWGGTRDLSKDSEEVVAKVVGSGRGSVARNENGDYVVSIREEDAKPDGGTSGQETAKHMDGVPAEAAGGGVRVAACETEDAGGGVKAG